MKNFFGKKLGKKYPERADEPQDILEEVYAGPSMQPRAMLVYMGPPTRPGGGMMFPGNPWNCTRCGKENGPLAGSCGYCGAPRLREAPVSAPGSSVPGDQPYRVCPACGAKNAGRFCAECGSDLRNEEVHQPKPEECNV